MTSDPGDQPGRPLPRIGDAERQAAVDALKEHYVAGRLNDAEFNERLDAAMEARTRADLGPLFSDLPPLGAFGPDPAPSQEMAPAQAPYLPAMPPPAPPVPATTGTRTRAQTLQLVRSLVWPVAIGLWIFTGIPFWPLLVSAIVASVVVSRLLEQEKQAGRAVPPAWQDPTDGDHDEPPSIGPSGPGSPRP
ncbi:DUF1707 SHOCT-like domain-containing protein [Raineyella antarctica]|nr:DUF1707 domain-containing protein [Raineyella antarctica]